METVLALAGPSDVVREPFPHVVVRGAIDDGVCSALIEQFPPLELVTRAEPYKSNRRFDYRAVDSLDDSRVSPLWREMIAAHVSQRFLEEALRLFGDSIHDVYPHFESDFGELDRLRAGVRRVDTFDSAEVLLDAQISVNTPVTIEGTSVRKGHLDAPNKLFVGLLYLRHPDDRSTGGDLELYRYTTDDPVFTGTAVQSAISDEYLEAVETIPFERNLLVFFLNSFDALHGVTVRSRTEVPRLFMNLVAEVPRPLFQVPLVGDFQDPAPEGAPVALSKARRSRAAAPTATPRRRRAAAAHPLRRPRPAIRGTGRAIRQHVLAATLLVFVWLILLFVLLPEELGDRPYDVFGLKL